MSFFKVDDLNAKANSVLTYSNLVLSEMQKETAPSEADGKFFSSPQDFPT